jgi:hypothetical protein
MWHMQDVRNLIGEDLRHEAEAQLMAIIGNDTRSPPPL